ncbi:MAG: hypothetical protein ACTSYQ_00445 [Candidatus Odinarchaeia archaeon]
MNYKIILDEQKLSDFIAWLPDLVEGECYYVALFARKKYHGSAQNDKCNCKRFTATDKEWLMKKIRQLEIPTGEYFNKNRTPVHNDALALYISINPRSFAGAQKRLLIRLAEKIAGGDMNSNPASMAMSEIQKSKSRTVFVDFDFDDVQFRDLHPRISKIINRSAYEVLITRGGFHLLVEPSKVSPEFKHTWHKYLTSIPQCDVTGDNMIPLAGCSQGSFTPWLI